MRLSWGRSAAPPLIERPEAAPLLSRDEVLNAVSQAVVDAINKRRDEFTLDDAMRLPAVRRAVDLIVSTAGLFPALAYGEHGVLTEQPTLVLRPDPYSDGQRQFVVESVLSLIREGDAFWDDLGTGIRVLDPLEVNVQWRDDRMLERTFMYRGQKRDSIVQVSINRRPGQLRGTSPLREALPYLAPVAAAEDYAMSMFAGGSLPGTVLTSKVKLTADEAARLKAAYMATRAAGEPAVIGGDYGIEFPPVDPMKMQLQEARGYGATIVGRLLGIPAALLHIETSGSSILYQNVQGALNDLTKSTILPMYLRPIEEAWTALLTRIVPANVVFDIRELERTDLAGRIAIYKDAIEAGIMVAAEARGFEGWGPAAGATDGGNLRVVAA